MRSTRPCRTLRSEWRAPADNSAIGLAVLLAHQQPHRDDHRDGADHRSEKHSEAADGAAGQRYEPEREHYAYRAAGQMPFVHVGPSVLVNGDVVRAGRS